MFKQRCIRLLLLASAIATSFSAAAYDFESNGIYYNINDDKETVTVTNKGDNIITYEGDIEIPTNVNYENKIYKVTEISPDAFRACSGLTSIIIPDGIEKIGDSAFQNCTSLTSVIVPGSVKELSRTFSGCTGLVSATLKSGVEVLGTEVFSHCSSLTDIQLEEGLKYVCICSVNECYAIKSLVLPSTVIDVSGAAFNGSTIIDLEIKAKTPPNVSNPGYYLRMDDMFIKVPKESIELYKSTEHWKDLTYYCYSKKENGITYIIDNNYAYAYKSDDNLSSVEILSSIEYNDLLYPVKKIMHDTFKDKTNLTSVSIPTNVVSIEKLAFYGCSNLISVEFPESLQNIGEAAFKSCGFADITLPESLKTLGNNAFEQCVNLTSISIPNQIKIVPSHCFNQCSSLESIAIPDGVTKIEEGAFGNLSAVESIHLPESITDIEINAFSGCRKLKEVNIPHKIKDIKWGTFYDANSLLSINIPEGVETIERYAFYGTTSLKGILDLPSTLKEIGEEAFIYSNYTICRVMATVPPKLAAENSIPSFQMVIVPEGSEAAYNAAPYWKGMRPTVLGRQEIEVTTTEPGKLASTIDKMGYRLALVTKLKVIGPLNDTDIKTTIGRNMTSCYNVDLSEADCENIPYESFKDKGILMGIKLPYNLRHIGASAFEGCSALSETLTFPETLETIDNFAFRGCGSLKQVLRFPSSLKSIGTYAFNDCVGVTAIDMLDPYDFTTLESGVFENCWSIKTVYLPMTLERISNNAFSRCSSLRSIDLPASLKAIGFQAFAECTSLPHLDLFKSQDFTEMQYEAFSGCKNLATINLPASLTHIGERAFSGCKAIYAISCPALVPPTADRDAFKNVDNINCILSIPGDKYDDYLNSDYWGSFAAVKKSVLIGIDGEGSIWYGYGASSNKPENIAGRKLRAASQEEASDDAINAVTFNGAYVRIKEDESIAFRIQPQDNNRLERVTYNGQDVTASVTDGTFTTPAMTADTKLQVTFGEIYSDTDYIAVPAVAVSKGAEVVMPVELVNTTEVMGIECKVQIPDGFSVAKNADGSLKVEQTDRKADQVLTVTADGNILTVKTRGTQAYSGNEGAVFTVAITPDETTTPADYALKVTDVTFISADGSASRPDAKATLTLRDYVLGDVDSDQMVAINDAVIVMNHIVGADTPAFNVKAADMDGNGSVEINDAVLIMNAIVDTESTKAIKRASATELTADELTAGDIEVYQGETAMLSLDLTNLDALTAAQFEITLPEGISAGKAVAGERASRHMVKTNQVGNVLKVAMLSAESANFEGSEGAILTLPLTADKTMATGNYGISLRNVKMSDAQGNLFLLPDTDSSVTVKNWGSVDSIGFDMLHVYGGNGEIYIESPSDTTIQIVAVNGRAFAVEVAAGKTTVAASAGVYVVNGQKVIVK